MKIATVVGARPQLIKAAVISRLIQQKFSTLTECLIHTGQHYDKDMSDIFFTEMEIPHPLHSLGINNASNTEMTGRMLIELEKVLKNEMPDVVLVYGDTTSTLAGALAAAQLRIPVAHVEAGLRSFNRAMPEETNRILTDQVSTWLFCPTETATENLRREGYYESRHHKIIKTGDIMLDAFLFYQQKAKPSPQVSSLLEKSSGPVFLATLHRAENTDYPERLHEIIGVLEKVCDLGQVIFPIHPRTRKRLDQFQIPSQKITWLDPVGYFDMISLLKRVDVVLTDSGGLQKEAYFAQKPCVVLRDETEWVELVEKGVAQVTGSSEAKIFQALDGFKKVHFPQDLYGDGQAGEKILKTLTDSF